MAEFFEHPADMLCKVPDQIPWDIIPLAEPLTIALHGLHRAKLKAGEHIAISGAGPIGLLAAMAAMYYGAYPIMIDPVDERLEKAKILGVTDTINPGQECIDERICEFTDGRMTEVVMEASGSNTAIRNTLNIVSNAGRIILTGWPKSDTLLPTSIITKKEVDICGARTSAGEFNEAIELIFSGKVDVRSILTHVAPINNVPDMVRSIEKSPGDYLKVVAVISDL